MPWVISIIKIVSSHSSLSVSLLLKFFFSHVSWLSLIMNSMSCVIILRMISHSKVRSSQICFCFLVQSYFSKIIWGILIKSVICCHLWPFVILKIVIQLRFSHGICIKSGFSLLSSIFYLQLYSLRMRVMMGCLVLTKREVRTLKPYSILLSSTCSFVLSKIAFKVCCHFIS